MYNAAARSLRVGPSTCTRSFSSTPPPLSFFFRRPTAPSSQAVFEDLLKAKKDGRIDLVAKNWPALRTAVQQAPLDIKSHGQLRSIMMFAASTGNSDLVLTMFTDLSKFGITPTLSDHHILLQALGAARKPRKALGWIDSMPETYGLTPRVIDWNIVLDAYLKAGDLEGMNDVLARMKIRGVEPNAASYNTFISASFALGDVEAAHALRQEMEAEGVSPDPVTETTLMIGYLEADQWDRAADVRRRLDAQVTSWLKDGQSLTDVAAVNGILKHESRTRGSEAGVQLAERFLSQGIKLDAWTFTMLAMEVLVGVSTAEEGVRVIEVLETSLQAAAPASVWTMLEVELLKPAGGINEALKAYEEARGRSIRPDSAMVQPLLTALCAPSPTPESLEKAKEIYEDLASSSRAVWAGPDGKVYETLLRACANTNNPDFDFSRRLTSDMRDRGIRPLAASLTWQIVAQMRAARDWKEAFEAYDTLRGVNAKALNVRSYNTILDAFTSLDLPAPSGNATTVHTFIQEILSDMRLSQNPLNAITYSLLLTYYSRLGESSASAVAHLHSLIRVDSNLDPDISLFNALMNAYSRVRSFPAAFRVWDSMRATRGSTKSGAIDNFSVSIVLDTCGWTSSEDGLARGREIWESLRSEKFPLNLKNYDTWVECLCRRGALQEAERVVFEDMAVGRQVEAQPSSAEVLLKFARRNEGVKRGEEIWRRLQRDRPDLADVLAKQMPRLASNGDEP